MIDVLFSNAIDMLLCYVVTDIYLSLKSFKVGLHKTKKSDFNAEVNSFADKRGIRQFAVAARNPTAGIFLFCRVRYSLQIFLSATRQATDNFSCLI